jgi:N-acetyl-anhydromuramyl-L-alanine amidase AmpD
VLHSSYNASDGDQYDLEKTISQYETYGVGTHYIIDRKGVVYRLVEEDNIAYHAGASKMPDGRKNVNDFSIGIEMIATEESGYTDKQYAAVNALIADIKSRHKIKSVVGHADIAPGRKTDPWKFDWKKLR